MPIYEDRTTGWMRRKPQRGAAPKPVSEAGRDDRGGGGDADRLLELFTRLRGGGGDGSAAADYAARAAGETRAATTAHQRALEMQGQQQVYQRRLAEWQSRVAQQNAIYLQQRRQWFARQQAEEQRRYAVAEREKALEHERQLGISGLLQERQSRYAQMAPQDAIRATMFALGLGQGAEGFKTRAGQLRTTLAPLAGAEETARGQEEALSKLLGRRTAIGEYGVTGLGSVQQAAGAFARGGADAQRLLESAFGIGTTRREAGAPGMGRERLRELVGEVTPTGFM